MPACNRHQHGRQTGNGELTIVLHSLLHPQQPRAIKLNNVVDMVTICEETANEIRCGRPWIHPVSGAQPSLSELVQSKRTALQLFLRNANRGRAARAAATDGTFAVHSIVDHRPASQVTGHYDYKVRWQGYGSDDDTWEPDDHLGTAAEKVASYNESCPNIWQGHEQRLLWAGLGFGDTLQVLDTTDGSGYGEWLDAVVTDVHRSTRTLMLRNGVGKKRKTTISETHQSSHRCATRARH
jgi:hypothetical protein